MTRGVQQELKQPAASALSWNLRQRADLQCSFEDARAIRIAREPVAAATSTAASAAGRVL